MNTLLLNATYEPHDVVTARDAVVLVIDGKAELIESNGGVFRSQFLTFPVPSVIRLRKYVSVPYLRTVPLTTRTVLARDNGTCAYCGGRADTVDHVVPRARGGTHRWENVVAACEACNRRKGSRLIAELGWELRRVPTRPRGPGARLAMTRTVRDPAWAPYLQIA